MRRFLGFVDWRFLVSLALVLLVFSLIFSGWTSVKQNEIKDDRIQELIVLSQDKDDQAARDRAVAAKYQAELLSYTKKLAERQFDILAYLRRHGIVLPARLISVIEAPQIPRSISPPKVNKPGGRKPNPTVTPRSNRPGNKPVSPGKAHQNPRRGPHA